MAYDSPGRDYYPLTDSPAQVQCRPACVSVCAFVSLLYSLILPAYPVPVCVCVRERERERESAGAVCVCVRERERGRESAGAVCVCGAI